MFGRGLSAGIALAAMASAALLAGTGDYGLRRAPTPQKKYRTKKRPKNHALNKFKGSKRAKKMSRPKKSRR